MPSVELKTHLGYTHKVEINMNTFSFYFVYSEILNMSKAKHG